MDRVLEQFGPYELLRVIGRGGMGEVYEARDTEQERTVALKRLIPETADDDEFQKRFRREARLAARLNSPHVVPIHRHGEIDGRLFLDMRLVQGADLEEVLERDGALPAARAVAIIEQVASALDAAHYADLIHRDVKPSNVLLDRAVGARDFVYLVDFGITRSIGGDESVVLTAVNTVVGSLDYMAPERFSAQGGAGIDIYALGCLLFECLTARRPFPVDGFTELMTAHLNEEPPKPSEVKPGIAEAFDDVIATALAKDPEQRPASAGALAALARAALGSGVSAAVGPATTEKPTVENTGPTVETPRGPAPSVQPDPATTRVPQSAPEDSTTKLRPTGFTTNGAHPQRPGPPPGARPAPGSTTGTGHRPPGSRPPTGGFPAQAARPPQQPPNRPSSERRGPPPPVPGGDGATTHLRGQDLHRPNAPAREPAPEPEPENAATPSGMNRTLKIVLAIVLTIALVAAAVYLAIVLTP